MAGDVEDGILMGVSYRLLLQRYCNVFALRYSSPTPPFLAMLLIQYVRKEVKTIYI